MSLLTEERKKEINAMHVKSQERFMLEFDAWNKSQIPSDDFIIPWDLAPPRAVDVEVSFTFRDEYGEPINDYADYYSWYGIPKEFIKTVPHRHADLFIKYAEVAARRSDPWREFGYFYKGEKVRFEEEIRFYETDDYEFLGQEK